MSPPSMRTTPEVGDCSPVMTLNSVVLPAPFGPMRPVTQPAPPNEHILERLVATEPDADPGDLEQRPSTG